jgi:LmbE family N-acetylglucosaminyl deacetylase
MVTPLKSEAEWSPLLATIPLYQPPQKPLIVIAPHPDDETLGAGGLIAAHRARNLPVTVIAVTDGEHAYTDNTGLAALRSEEQTQALARLGVAAENIIRFHLTDSSVTKQEAELQQRLTPLIAADTLLCAPWLGDFHPDHEACARAAAAAARTTDAELLSYFFWTWHRGTPSTLQFLDLKKFLLTPSQCESKLQALACHHSQLHHNPEPEILPEDLLWPAQLPFEVFAQ